MLRYLRHLKPFFSEKTNTELGLANELTKEQKKKYRKQYLTVLISATLISLAYIIGIVYSVNYLFNDNNLFFIAIIVLILSDFERLVNDWKYKIELIEERIYKRTKKNRKQRRIVSE